MILRHDIAADATPFSAAISVFHFFRHTIASFIFQLRFFATPFRRADEFLLPHTLASRCCHG